MCSCNTLIQLATLLPLPICIEVHCNKIISFLLYSGCVGSYRWASCMFCLLCRRSMLKLECTTRRHCLWTLETDWWLKTWPSWTEFISKAHLLYNFIVTNRARACASVGRAGSSRVARRACADCVWKRRYFYSPSEHWRSQAEWRRNAVVHGVSSVWLDSSASRVRPPAKSAVDYWWSCREESC